MASSPRAQLGVSDDPNASRMTLRVCLEAALQQSEGLMERVLDGLSGKNDRMVAMGVGMHVKPNYSPATKVAIEVLLGQKEKICESFNNHLRRNVFMGIGTQGQTQQLMRFEDLKLFEEEDLDESIEVARALQEIGQAVDQTLPVLHTLMSTLLGWITVQPQINPLRPEMYVRALRECITEFIEDEGVRSTVITPAAGRLGLILSKLYAELNAWLISSGVEPAGTTAPGQTLASVAKPGVAAAVGNSVARTLLTLDRLRRLLSGELDGDGARKPQDFLHTVPASVVALQDMRQVEAMVRRLETKAKQAAENPQADAARKQAAARMAMADGKQLGKQLGEEVVRLMLDNLIQDDRLLPQVRGHLQTLEPLLMEIAQKDARFFSDKQHAARQFLDKVTNRSLGFATEKDDGYLQFVKSVQNSIAQLEKKASASEDVSLAFGIVMEKLDLMWERLDAEERVRREEAARALLHAEQRNMLAQYLANEFRTNAEGVDIPKAVVDFVCGPWAHVVAETQLRCTDGTSDPQGYQELVVELYWSVQPRVARRNRTRLVQMIPGMLAKLRLGLQSIEFPAERIADFFADLIGYHEAALEGGRPKPAQLDDASALAQMQIAAQEDRAALEALYAASSQAPLEGLRAGLTASQNAELDDAGPDEDAPNSSFWMAQNEVREAGFLDEDSVMPLDVTANAPESVSAPLVVNAIAIGSWVELMLEGIWVRAQLTWASPHRTLFMFISRGGKAHSMSQRTMDKLRAQGMIRVVSDGHMVDKALDAVAQTALRNSVNRSNPSAH